MSKKFWVIIAEENSYEALIEADTKEQAKEIALSGEVDFRYKDTLSGAEVIDITEEKT